MSDQTEAELERTRKVVAETMAAQNEANEEAIAADTADPAPAHLAESDEEGWDAYTKDELAAELADRGLAVSGSKAELVARLEEDDA